MNSNQNNNNNRPARAAQPRRRRRRARARGRPANAPPRGRAPLDPQGLNTHVKLSKHSVDWASTVANPFSTHRNVGIPDYPATLSRKTITWAKGSMNPSTTTGFGFVALEPDYLITNDLVAVRSNDATYALNTIDFGAAGAVLSMGNSDYISTQVGPNNDQIQYRIVGAGLRLRYTGTSNNKGGVLRGFADPRHKTVQGRDNSSLDGEVTSKKFAADLKEWTCVCYRHMDSDDLDYQQAVPVFGLLPNNPTFHMVATVAAPAGIAQSYDWEAFSHFEVIGRDVRGTSPSHCDPLGFAAVHAACNFGNVMIPYNTPSDHVAAKLVAAAVRYLGMDMSRAQHVTTPKPTSTGQAVLQGAATVASAANSIGGTIASIFDIIGWFL